MEIQGEVKMTISKLGSALAFCFAVSAGQANAEPVSVIVANYWGQDLQQIEFVPQEPSPKFTGKKQNADIIYNGKSGTVTFDKPSGVCKFAMRGVPTKGPYAFVYDFDVCKGNKVNVLASNDSSSNPQSEALTH